MKNENLKNYAITLWIIAVLIIIGVSSYWKFATWRIIDWLIVITVSYIGYKLYNHKFN